MSFKKNILLLFILSSLSPIYSQIGVQTFLDVGKNIASEGVFLKNGVAVDYQMDTYRFESGVQFDLVSNNPNILSGWDLTAGKTFLIQEFPFDVKAVLLINRYAEMLNESNRGIRIRTKKFTHWDLELGSNSKSYFVKYKFRDKNQSENTNYRVTEALDLTYLATYFLKKHDYIRHVDVLNKTTFLVMDAAFDGFKRASYLRLNIGENKTEYEFVKID